MIKTNEFPNDNGIPRGDPKIIAKGELPIPRSKLLMRFSIVKVSPAEITDIPTQNKNMPTGLPNLLHFSD